MSRGHGLHKLEGGIRARWRTAWQRLPEMRCSLERCDRPAAALIETIFYGPKPICAKHAPQAKQLGYPVYHPSSDEDGGAR